MIEQIIDHVLRTKRADRAIGWIFDAEHYFGEELIWQNTKVAQTEDPRCILELKATVGPACASLSNLTDKMRAIWKELAWSHWQTTSLTFYKQAVVLRFATMHADNSACLTGRMIAGGQRYLELVRERQIEAPRFGPLPNAPFEIDFSDLDSSYEFSCDLEFEEAARIHDTDVLCKIPVYLDRLAAADSKIADSVLLDMYTLLSLLATLRKRDANIWLGAG